MAEFKHLIDELVDAIPADERESFYYDAGAFTTQGRDLFSQRVWRERNRPLLASALLRRFDFSDAQIGRVSAEGDLELGKFKIFDVVYSMQLGSLETEADRFRLDELAATTAVSLEMCRAIAGALAPITRQLPPPPLVQVASGTVNFTLTATPLSVGLFAVLTCALGVPYITAAGISGGLTASAAVIDMALNWTDKVQDIRRKGAERNKLDAESDKLKAETAKFIAETEAIRRTQLDDEPKTPSASAASALVPTALVHSTSEALGLSSPLVNHLLNRGLPLALDARNKLTELRVTPRGKGAGA